MHQPGIERGSVPWQGTILPLDHWCEFALIVHRPFSLCLPVSVCVCLSVSPSTLSRQPLSPDQGRKGRGGFLQLTMGASF
ncbi:unnamed protein product [Spirodela intermedia]|uniref:Uncharacterized protein n=1 Tax=Spirodela intermedia TaxID=51605 RepID=A0A7I8JHG1_SPIIN|nr:unnamed protein product [Spirodela intermedia]CAA6669576.1 unnamed protein product [Spirodela intermedia]